jgi:hypothetical protein
MSPQHPARQGENSNNPHGNNSVIQRLAAYRIQSRQAENDTDEANPSHRNKSNGSGKHAQVERPLSRVELAGIDKPDEDRDSVRDIEPDCCDTGCGSKGDRTSEGGQRKTEGEEGGEPNGADRGAELVVDFVEEVWLLAVSMRLAGLKGKENARFRHHARRQTSFGSWRS